MTTTVLLELYVLPQISLHPDTGASISQKAGAQDFARFQNYTYHDGRDIARTTEGLGPENADDSLLLRTTIHPISRLREEIGNEGDVRRLFSRYFKVITNAMSTRGVTERWEIGPIGATNTSVTVDTRYTYRSETILLTELKRPWAIKENLWQDGGSTPDKRKLEKELRM